MANSIKQTEILLESGTNELEIMEFTISGELFGINVAKVKEILMACPVKPMQKSHPDIEGVFKPRDEVITVIDLSKYLGLSVSDNPDYDIFIVTTFNNLDFAFHVHSVVGIDRVSWSMMRKPDKIIYGGEEGVATGIAEFEGRLITILDLKRSSPKLARRRVSSLRISKSWAIACAGRSRSWSRRIACCSPS